MLVAAALCPAEVRLAADEVPGWLQPARDAALVALTALQDARPDVLFVVGEGERRLAYSSADWADLAPYGVQKRVRLGAGLCTGQGVLPPPLAIGGSLLGALPWSGDRQGYAVPADLESTAARAVGGEIADVDDRVALLVVGASDGALGDVLAGALDGQPWGEQELGDRVALWVRRTA